MPVTVDDIRNKVSVFNGLVDGAGFLLFKEADGLNRFKEFIQKAREE